MALPKHITFNLPGGVPMEFRLIVDEGKRVKFRMGSRGNDPKEEPIHEVIINQPYYLGVTPVTQFQYEVMAEECIYELDKIEDNRDSEPSYFDGGDRPVEMVNWQDAEVVCQWLTGFEALREELPSGWVAGLPNEAQWEYACRGGIDTDYHTGDGEAALVEAGWFAGNPETGTHSVGERNANKWGLYDMHGNVLEWCCDVFDPLAYTKRPDGWVARRWTERDAGKEVVADGPQRVLRGGSWWGQALACRSSRRGRGVENFRLEFGGFRIGLFPGSVPSSHHDK